MNRPLLSASAGLALAISASPASAAIFIVDAFTHSVNGGGGTPLSTGLTFSAGTTLTVSSSTNDLWSAGALPRFSDANGLTGNRLATALDDSGQPVGTLIGINFGTPTFNGHTAAFGSLVGRINGVYQTLGANFSGPAWATGELQLFYWDSNQGDNSGQIAFNIAAVPEPATWAMMIIGFGLIGGAMRARRQTVTFAKA
ncbi:MAG: hypothetical protein RL481_925 [Pseudomonadota bacterium]